jgi:RHS repeat-associated protein
LAGLDGRDARWGGFGSGIHFTGKEQEGYEGDYMHYFDARYFSGGFGRFMSPDPDNAGSFPSDPQTWNAYAYVRNNPGKERDAESGLDYFGARYFSGAQGRFTSPDKPFADQSPDDPQSWNLYGYVRNNPLRLIDPSGSGAEQAESWQMRLVLGTAYGIVNRALLASNNSSPREFEKMVDSGSWDPRVYGAVAEATAAAMLSMAPTLGSPGQMAVQFQPQDLLSQGLRPDLKWQNSNNTVLPDGTTVSSGTTFYGQVKAAGADNPRAYDQIMSGAVDTAKTATALAKGGGGVAALIVNAATWNNFTTDQQKAIRAAAGGGQIFALQGLNSGTNTVVKNISGAYKWLKRVF